MNKTERNVLCTELRELAGTYDGLSTRLFTLAAKLEENDGSFCRRSSKRFRANRKRVKSSAGIAREGDTE